ncbi:MAG: exosome complex component [Candidatus Woesearchaeota archaeon]|nr:exosome complex component [Candidatus Woesearchaeota archaeon]
MSYDKRVDGRGFDELRKIEAKVGVIPRADGSAFFSMGGTSAYAAVYGPRQTYPKFLQDPSKGVLRCHYAMMPFSGAGDRVKPGPNRRAKEISLVTTNALLPAIDLHEFPNAIVDVFISLPETDAGSRCAGICAASLALADAGIPMTELVGAVAVGRVDDKVVVDLCYDEEAYEEGEVADIPVAILYNKGEISLLQMDGKISKDMLLEALEKAKKALNLIHDVQVKALKERFKQVENIE